MSAGKDLEKKVRELDQTYEAMVDSYGLDEIAWHYRVWIDVWRKEQQQAPYRAMPEEKIQALERAVEDFDAVYQAEKAEAEKMPLSWAEAERVRDVFDEIFKNRHEPPPVARAEH